MYAAKLAELAPQFKWEVLPVCQSSSLHIYWETTHGFREAALSKWSSHGRAFPSPAVWSVGLPLGCSISTPTTQAGRNMRSSWSWQCPQPVWPLWDLVQPHIPPKTARYCQQHSWKDILLPFTEQICPGEDGLPEAIQHHCTCWVSERFVLVYIVHQTHSGNLIMNIQVAE